MATGKWTWRVNFSNRFFVDSSKKEIIVLDLYRTLKRYSFAGDFLAEEHKEIPYFSFTLHNRDTLLFDSNLSEKSANQLAVYNPKGRREYLPKNTNLKKVGFMPSNVLHKGMMNIYMCLIYYLILFMIILLK